MSFRIFQFQAGVAYIVTQCTSGYCCSTHGARCVDIFGVLYHHLFRLLDSIHPLVITNRIPQRNVVRQRLETFVSEYDQDKTRRANNSKKSDKDLNLVGFLRFLSRFWDFFQDFFELFAPRQNVASHPNHPSRCKLHSQKISLLHQMKAIETTEAHRLWGMKSITMVSRSNECICIC